MDKSGATINSFDFEKEDRGHNSKKISHNVNGMCMAHTCNEKLTCKFTICKYVQYVPSYCTSICCLHAYMEVILNG